MTDRQIPQTNYLPPHLVPVKFMSLREISDLYPPQTPDEVMSLWRRVAEQDKASDEAFYAGTSWTPEQQEAIRARAAVQ